MKGKTVWLLLAMAVSGINAWAAYVVITYGWLHTDTTAKMITAVVVGIATYGAAMIIISLGQQEGRI